MRSTCGLSLLLTETHIVSPLRRMTLGRNEYYDDGQCIGELLMKMQGHKSGTYRAPPMTLLLLAFVPAGLPFNSVGRPWPVNGFGPATLTLVRWSLSALVIG